jgi:thiol-disulfide isomerase/thioredoxin
MKKTLSIIVFISFLINAGRSQSVPSMKTDMSPLNKLCPDFVFDSLINYKKEKLAISDLKGRFVIIDFWGTFCLPCIKEFPKIEELQKRFGDTLQVLLVATDGFQKAKHFYETRRKNNRPMLLPCTVNTDARNYFQIRTVSTYVWLDDQGYVKAITDDSQLTEQNIADFVNRRNIRLRGIESHAMLDGKRPLVSVAHEMDSSNVIYNSSLTKYLKGVAGTYYYPKKGIGTKIFAHNASINTLYRLAFGDSTGAIKVNRLVNECAHPEKFELPKDWDFQTWKYDNAYCYELIVPKAKENQILKIMQEDLKRLFGANVFFEERTQKCLVLKAGKNPHLLADKTSTPKRVYNGGGITVTNTPFDLFVEMIRYYNQTKIVLDETGITGNVTIALEAQMNDVDALNEALKKIDLYLQYEDRPVQMLLIKDPG